MKVVANLAFLMVMPCISGNQLEPPALRRGGVHRILQQGFQCDAPSVTGFTIVDKEGNVLHNLTLGPNGVISATPLEMVNIRVEFSDGQYLPVDSMEVAFNGTSASPGQGSKCENFEPYTVFGDPSSQDLVADQADYNRYAATIPYGVHKIFASPFLGNNCCGCAKKYSAQFRIKQVGRLLEGQVDREAMDLAEPDASDNAVLSNPSSTCFLPQVTGFTFVDGNGNPLATLSPGANGIVLPSIAGSLEDVNIRVEVKSASDLPVMSVQVSFDGSNSLRGPKQSCENFAPYTIFGDPSSQNLQDDSANYKLYAVTITPGQHTISATAFPGTNCCGCGSESSVTSTFTLGTVAKPDTEAPTRAPSSGPVESPTAAPTKPVAPSSGPLESPTAAPTKSVASQEKGLTCIAVIDENNSDDTEAQWAKFRSDFPDRKFCLLQPTTDTAEEGTGSLYVPSDFSSSSNRKHLIYAKVNRDGGNKALASDWYKICKLEQGSKAQGYTNVALFVDNSGSMTTSTVQASLTLFNNKTAANGLQIESGVYNSKEDYISPCATTTLLGE